MPIQKSKSRLTSFSLFAARIILFVVLMALGAQLSINTGLLSPFTLQTLVLGVMFCFMTRRARILAVTLYLICGISGLPVFSNAASGIDVFISPMLGFFVGFLLAAWPEIPLSNKAVPIFTYFLIIHFIILFSGLISIGIFTSSMDAVANNMYALLPGLALKAIAGTGLVWLIKNRNLIFNSRNTG